MGTFYNLHFQESAMTFATQSQLRRKEQRKALKNLDNRSNVIVLRPQYQISC
jgi:hypothetical protein